MTNWGDIHGFVVLVILELLIIKTVATTRRLSLDITYLLTFVMQVSFCDHVVDTRSAFSKLSLQIASYVF